jgi:hypothetical protein
MVDRTGLISDNAEAASLTLQTRDFRGELPDGAALFTDERVVSVYLPGKSRPGTSEISQNLGFSLILRQFHQATAFF